MYIWVPPKLLVSCYSSYYKKTTYFMPAFHYNSVRPYKEKRNSTCCVYNSFTIFHATRTYPSYQLRVIISYTKRCFKNYIFEVSYIFSGFLASTVSFLSFCILLWPLYPCNILTFKLHKKALTIVYNDSTSIFEEICAKDNSFSIHHRNLQVFATEMCEVHSNIAPDLIFLKKGNTI